MYRCGYASGICELEVLAMASTTRCPIPLSDAHSRSFSARFSHQRRQKAQFRASIVANAAVGGTSTCVSGTPADYNFRLQTSAETAAVVEREWPQLMDIVEDGTLVVVERPLDCSGEEPEIVILVGTTHVSRVSAEQVERVIEAVRPDNVVVELCRSRVGIMYSEPTSAGPETKRGNLFSLTGTDRNAALFRSFKLGGRSAFFLRLLMARASERISKSAPVPTGEEFRAARKAAKAVGAQLVLGDRPIEITLKRAWSALNWNERLRLASTLWQVICSSKIDVSETALQMLKTDDAISAMYSEMSNRFPSLLQSLVWERDLYLAWSLKRSKAVSGCKTVVGVIGRGHMRGVVYSLYHSQEHLRFRDLVGSAGKAELHSRSGLSRILKNLIVEGVIGLVLWVIYDYISRNWVM